MAPTTRSQSKNLTSESSDEVQKILVELNNLVKTRTTFGESLKFKQSFLRILELSKNLPRGPNIPPQISYHRLLRENNDYIYMAPEEFEMLYNILRVYVQNITNNTSHAVDVIVNGSYVTFVP